MMPRFCAMRWSSSPAVSRMLILNALNSFGGTTTRITRVGNDDDEPCNDDDDDNDDEPCDDDDDDDEPCDDDDEPCDDEP